MNTFLPTKNKISTTFRVARYREIVSYNKAGQKSTYLWDAEFDKITFLNAYLRKLYLNPNLKELDFRILLYIANSLKKDCVDVQLCPEKLKKKFHKSNSTISASIKRLVNAKVIEKVPGVNFKYEINPTGFYKGKRIEYLNNIDPSLVMQIQ